MVTTHKTNRRLKKRETKVGQVGTSGPKERHGGRSLSYLFAPASQTWTPTSEQPKRHRQKRPDKNLLCLLKPSRKGQPSKSENVSVIAAPFRPNTTGESEAPPTQQVLSGEPGLPPWTGPTPFTQQGHVRDRRAGRKPVVSVLFHLSLLLRQRPG